MLSSHLLLHRGEQTSPCICGGWGWLWIIVIIMSWFSHTDPLDKTSTIFTETFNNSIIKVLRTIKKGQLTIHLKTYCFQPRFYKILCILNTFVYEVYVHAPNSSLNENFGTLRKHA